MSSLAILAMLDSSASVAQACQQDRARSEQALMQLLPSCISVLPHKNDRAWLTFAIDCTCIVNVPVGCFLERSNACGSGLGITHSWELVKISALSQ